MKKFIWMVGLFFICNVHGHSSPARPFGSAQGAGKILRGMSKPISSKKYDELVTSQGPLEARESTFQDVVVQGSGYFDGSTVNGFVEGQGQLVLDRSIARGDVKYSGPLYILNNSAVHGKITGAGPVEITDATVNEINLKGPIRIVNGTIGNMVLRSNRVELDNTKAGDIKIYTSKADKKVASVYIKGTTHVEKITFLEGDGAVYVDDPRSFQGKVFGGVILPA